MGGDGGMSGRFFERSCLGMMNVIGLMSGTSVDGIDAALVEVGGQGYDLGVKLVVGQTMPYPVALREQILAVCAGEALSMAQMAGLDDAIATTFAQATQALLTQVPEHQPVSLIGSHGQTLYHRPPEQTDPAVGLGYSLQLGRGALIAALTGVPTVSNFRVADIACGGQGAPLVSPIDACLISHPHHSRCVQNWEALAMSPICLPGINAKGGHCQPESGAGIQALPIVCSIGPWPNFLEGSSPTMRMGLGPPKGKSVKPY
jgi:1,6-anhydro-N-acetylmuramate kinase